MKKFLLSAIVALVAVSASAGEYKMMTSKLSLAHKYQKEVKSQVPTAITAMAKPAAKVSLRRTEEESEEVFGSFVTRYDGQVIDGFVGASNDILYKTAYDMTFDDGEGGTITIPCNIHVKDLFGGLLVDNLYGVYDAESNTIWFPNQQVLHIESEEGASQAYNYDIEIVGCVIDEDGEIESYTPDYGVTFVGDENGNFTCESSWCYYYVDHATQQGLGPGETVINATMMVANGALSYSYATSGWKKVTEVAAIDDWETSVTLYGFWGTKLEFDIDDDMTVHMPLGQPLADKSLAEESFDYGCMHTVGVKETETGIALDLDATEVLGTLKENTIAFPAYFRSLSNLDAEGTGYGGPWFAGLAFMLSDGNFQAWKGSGIEEKGMTREEKLKSTKTYNLMGQQVNRKVAKGLLIRDGKKYVNK